MMGYREQVQRVVSGHHARLELGLSRAREQESFVNYVMDKLKAARIAFTWQLDTSFNAQFWVSHQDKSSLKALFGDYWQCDGSQQMVLNQECDEAVQVRFIWKDD